MYLNCHISVTTNTHLISLLSHCVSLAATFVSGSFVTFELVHRISFLPSFFIPSSRSHEFKQVLAYIECEFLFISRAGRGHSDLWCHRPLVRDSPGGAPDRRSDAPSAVLAFSPHRHFKNWKELRFCRHATGICGGNRLEGLLQALDSENEAGRFFLKEIKKNTEIRFKFHNSLLIANLVINASWGAGP